MTKVTIQEVPIALIIPLPFEQISDHAKMHRAPDWREIKEEVDKIAMDNKAEIVDLLSNSMIKAMMEDISLGKVSDSTLKEVNSKIEYLNLKFKHINDYFESRDPYTQRSLLAPFIDEESSSLARYKENFRILVTSKTKWELTDSLIYPYYLLYQETINVYRLLLQRSSKETINNRLNLLKSLMFFYKPIILAYILGKHLPSDILVKKISELRANVNPQGVYAIAPNIYETLEVVSTIPPE